MGIKTTLEQLEEVQEAIREAEVSEELGDGQSRVRWANLEILYKREERLLVFTALRTLWAHALEYWALLSFSGFLN